jgi:sugar O-acyltransferase (sialic acid O-acetyltransferase NeuD family)
VKPLLIIGSSGHAATIIEAIELRAEYQIIGLIDSFECKGSLKHGYAIRGTLEDSVAIAESLGCSSFFVAVGDNWKRWSVASFLKSKMPGMDFPIVLYPNVMLSKSASIGPGTVVMPAGVIMANASLGEGCIVNAASTINHHSHMEDYSSVASGVHLAGQCGVGFRSSVGPGAVLREKCTVGRDSVVGAGSVVLNDIPDKVLAYGVPAKVIRQRTPDEPYLR